MTRKSRTFYTIFVVTGLLVSVANAQFQYYSTNRFVEATAENLCESVSVFDQNMPDGEYNFTATATANPIVGCSNFVVSSVAHSSTFAPDILRGQGQVFSQADGSEFASASARSTLEAQFIIDTETPFLLRGGANDNGFVELEGFGGVTLAELRNTSVSSVTGILTPGVYDLNAGVSTSITDGTAEGDYFFDFQLVPEPSPACLLLMGIIPFFQLARKQPIRRQTNAT